MLNMENYELTNVDLEEEMIVACTNEDIANVTDILSDAASESLSNMEEGEEKDKLINKLETIKKFPSIIGEMYFSTPEVYVPKGLNVDEWNPTDDEHVDIVVKMPMYLVINGTVRDVMELGALVDKAKEDN